jgi:hypothetical protein
MVGGEGRAASSQAEEEAGARVCYAETWTWGWTEIEVSCIIQTIVDQAEIIATSKDGKV